MYGEISSKQDRESTSEFSPPLQSSRRLAQNGNSNDVYVASEHGTMKTVL